MRQGLLMAGEEVGEAGQGGRAGVSHRLRVGLRSPA